MPNENSEVSESVRKDRELKAKAKNKMIDDWKEAYRAEIERLDKERAEAEAEGE